jgi:hypothetical protein
VEQGDEDGLQPNAAHEKGHPARIPHRHRVSADDEQQRQRGACQGARQHAAPRRDVVIAEHQVEQQAGGEHRWDHHESRRQRDEPSRAPQHHSFPTASPCTGGARDHEHRERGRQKDHELGHGRQGGVEARVRRVEPDPGEHEVEVREYREPDVGAGGGEGLQVRPAAQPARGRSGPAPQQPVARGPPDDRQHDDQAEGLPGDRATRASAAERPRDAEGEPRGGRREHNPAECGEALGALQRPERHRLREVRDNEGGQRDHRPGLADPQDLLCQRDRSDV